MRLVECQISLPYHTNKRSNPIRIALNQPRKNDLANGPFPGNSHLKRINYLKKINRGKKGLGDLRFFKPI